MALEFFGGGVTNKWLEKWGGGGGGPENTYFVENIKKKSNNFINKNKYF